MVLGLDGLGFVREVVGNDSDPALRIKQDGSGRILELVDTGGTVQGYVTSGGELVALKDIDAQGAIKNTGAANGGAVYVDDVLTVTGTVNLSQRISGMPQMDRGSSSDLLKLRGGANPAGSGAAFDLWGKDHANAGRMDALTPDAAGSAFVTRFDIPGAAAQGSAGVKFYENLKMQTVGDKFQSIETPVKAGTLADADFNDAQDGLLALDSTNGRLYLRYGGAWHYIAVTA